MSDPSPYPNGIGPHIDSLRRRLNAPLPGTAIWHAMVPPGRLRPTLDEARAAGCREGGVLLLLYPHRDQPHVVLTLRSAVLRSHPGQISLPGGRLEPGESVVAAALREAWEELGVRREAVDVLGQLTPFYIPPSNFCLTPVVAATPRRPRFAPQVEEVDQIIESPLDQLLDPANRRTEMWEIQGEARRIGYFQLGPHKVWGATAMVLLEFVALWAEVAGGTDGGN